MLRRDMEYEDNGAREAENGGEEAAESEPMPGDYLQNGLSEVEVRERVERGKTNEVREKHRHP